MTKKKTCYQPPKTQTRHFLELNANTVLLALANANLLMFSTYYYCVMYLGFSTLAILHLICPSEHFSAG